MLSLQHEFRIVITPFCNYRCFYCHKEGLTEECTRLTLTPEDYAFMCGVAKDRWGWDIVTITGGEPFISPIYRETCELIAAHGIKITTVTNASLIVRPKQMLKDNHQVNISVHSLSPEIYKKITMTTYPVQDIVDTIISIRAQLPTLEIHLNSTVIRGMNDDLNEIDKLSKFARRINATMKFIDLASNNENLIVPVEEIIQNLFDLGFKKMGETKWQIFAKKANGEKAIITRCGFGIKYADWGYRNIFINPDGVLSTEVADDIPLNLLHEIRTRDADAFACKVEWMFPPLSHKNDP